MAKKEFKSVSRAVLAFIILVVITIGALYNAHVNLLGTDVALQPFAPLFGLLALGLVFYVASVIWKKPAAEA